MSATTTPIPDYAALGNLPELHLRIAKGIVWLRAHNQNAVQFEAGRTRVNGIADEYLRALVVLRDSMTDDELTARIAANEAALNATEDREDEWVQLLTVHEVLVDAQLVGTYLERLRERIDGCRALQPVSRVRVGESG